MSDKPDWCPQDVWNIACRLGTIDATREPIARAILAERERCARAAAEMVNNRQTCPAPDVMYRWVMSNV